MSEVEFPEGLRVYAPREGAPSFIKASIVIERRALMMWLDARKEDTVRLDVKESRNGKLYAAVNTWKPQPDAAEVGNQTKPKVETSAHKSGMQTDGFEDSDIPF